MVLDDIRKLNMDYLLLARDLIRDDRLTAMYMLALPEDAIDLIDSLSPVELTRVADTNVLLCQFRMKDKALLQMLKDHANGNEYSQTHALLINTSDKQEGNRLS